MDPKLLTKDSEKSGQAKYLLSMLVHDLKSPVHNIVGFSNLLEGLMVDDKNSDFKTYIRIINQEAELLLRLVSLFSDLCKQADFTIDEKEKSVLKEMLDFSQTERDKMPVGA